MEQALQEKDWSVLEATIESWHATVEVLASAELTAILTESTSDDLEDWNDVDDTRQVVEILYVGPHPKVTE